MKENSEDMKRKLNRFRAWVRLKVPPGMRFLIGVLLIIMGFFGFLPVLGFWMVPLGVAVAAMDVAWIKAKWARLTGKQ